MKALCWQGNHDIALKHVHDPSIINPSDAVIRVTTTAICGSDLHLYDGYIPTMEKGDILGHECMGEVMEIGRNVKKIKVGDKVVIPFDLACGKCHHCLQQKYSGCENTNPNCVMADKAYGHSGAAMLGYSHMFGGYAGGQSELFEFPSLTPTRLLFLKKLAMKKFFS
jgi:threonine dehydrogenase-like Zn-dependent dehydrogenase